MRLIKFGQSWSSITRMINQATIIWKCDWSNLDKVELHFNLKPTSAWSTAQVTLFMFKRSEQPFPFLEIKVWNISKNTILPPGSYTWYPVRNLTRERNDGFHRHLHQRKGDSVHQVIQDWTYSGIHFLCSSSAMPGPRTRPTFPRAVAMNTVCCTPRI